MKTYICGLVAYFYIFGLTAQPTITSFSPATGPVGTVVTISGNNFSASVTGNIVYVGGIKAQVLTAAPSSFTIIVPVGAVNLPISVTTNHLTAYAAKAFKITFSGASAVFSPGSFGYAAYADSVDALIETTSYTIADINNDTRPDVLTIDRLDNKLSFYRNTTQNGSVSFAPESSFAAGTSPRCISTADVDGDGKIDVIVSNLSSSTVSVFRNTSLGNVVSYAPALNFATAFQPAGIAVADLDKDGRPDLVINTVNANGWVSVLRNNSVGTGISFDAKFDLQSIGGSIQNIAVADINGDGYTDICVPNYSLSSISIFRNTSTIGVITFASKIDIPTAQLPSEIAVSDLNEDGKPDIAIGYFAGYKHISTFKNTSNGADISFVQQVDLLTGSVPDAIAIHDLNGDGKDDVVVASGSDLVSLFKNVSTPGGSISFSPANSFASIWPGPVCMGDFDLDGKPDIALKSGLFRVTIWKNKTTEPYISTFSPAASGSDATVTITGLNFTGATAVSFGGIAAASFTVINATTISAVVGTGASGSIAVTTSTGVASKPGFTFYPVPTISTFIPDTATTGTIIIVSGMHFTHASAVSFGGVSAASFTVLNDTTLRAAVGAGSTGSVTVTTTGGITNLSGFVYVPLPIITSFTPLSGGPGTGLAINGNNFTAVTSVTIGGVQAASFVVNSSSRITAVVGAGGSGNISVISSLANSSLAGFTFLPSTPPTIRSFSPLSGPVGTSVTLLGSGFNTITTKNTVFFGATKAYVSSASTSQLVVIVPPGATYQPISVFNAQTYVSAYSALPFLVTFAGGGAGFTPFSFAPKKDFAVGSISGYTTSSDLDGDGKADILFGDQGHGLTILRIPATPPIFHLLPK
jgi:hypothetical protein